MSKQITKSRSSIFDKLQYTSRPLNFILFGGDKNKKNPNQDLVLEIGNNYSLDRNLKKNKNISKNSPLS